jgi:hypothetical protein
VLEGGGPVDDVARGRGREESHLLLDLVGSQGVVGVEVLQPLAAR